VPAPTSFIVGDCCTNSGKPCSFECAARLLEKDFVTSARPPWMAEVLETQEQFPVQAGVQELITNAFVDILDSGFRRNDEDGAESDYS
jgi:hypothetical protein